MKRVPPFLLLVTVSGLVHAGVFGGAYAWLSGPRTDAPVEIASMTIALGSAGASAGEKAEEQAEEVPEPPVETEPEPEPEPVPRPAPRPEPLPEPDPEPEPEPVTETTAPAPPPPEQEPAAAVTAEIGFDGSAGEASETPEDTDGEADEAGYETLIASHDGLVLRHLSRFKTFPPDARMRAEEGDVAVEFEIDRHGQLIDCRIVRTSGSRRLDKAALRQMEDAVPYPAAPGNARWETRLYSTSMRYRLRDAR